MLTTVFSTDCSPNNTLVKQRKWNPLSQVYYRHVGVQEFEAPRFQDSRYMKVVRFSALRTGRLYPPGNIPGTYFCWRLSQPQSHSAAGRIMSMKNSNNTIGNQTRDFPIIYIYIYIHIYIYIYIYIYSYKGNYDNRVHEGLTDSKLRDLCR